MHTNERWTLDRFEVDEEELARHNDPEQSKNLGLNMLALGQLHPVVATESGRMICGHGRYLAAKLVGIETLEVKVVPELDENGVDLTRAAENLKRKDWTDHRKSKLCEELGQRNGWTQKTLAEKLNMGESMVVRWLSPSKCIPEVQEALRDGKIGISACYAISKLPPEEQSGLLALKLSGASRDELERQGRRKRLASKPAVRTSKIRCPLAGGHVVTVAAEEMSLDEAIEALKEALKAMTKARDTGLDAKTAQAVWKDMARAAS